MNFADVISIDWSIDESDVWLIDRSFDWLIDWSKFVVLMVVDVIGIFGFNFITVGLEGPGPDSEGSGSSENSEDSQSLVDFKEFGEFIADLFSEFTFMTMPTSFFSVLSIRW